MIRETEKDLRDAFLKDLEEGLFNKPYFVFEDVFEPELRKNVSAMCNDNDVVCKIISSVDDAIKMRTKFQNLDMGVFFIQKEFGRGLDPKLKIDAFVCIYEGVCDLEFKDRVEPQFTESEVHQIFGRSSRQQSQGTYWRTSGIAL